MTIGAGEAEAPGSRSKPAYGLLYRLNSRVRWELTRIRDGIGDLAMGISTGWRRSEGPPPKNFESSPYEAISYDAIGHIARRLKLGPDDVVADIGCGKGRALCWFAARPIRKAVGIEFDPGLAKVARRNADAVRGRRADVEILVGDAAEQSYEGVSVIFLFNPFGRRTMQAVIDRIGRDRKGSAVRIAYVNPLVGDVLDDTPWLVRGETFPVFHLMGKTFGTIWTSRQAGALTPGQADRQALVSLTKASPPQQSA